VRIGRLHILTDTSIQSRFDSVELAELAIRGGADTIQFRRKSGSTREWILEARQVRAVCRRAGVPMIVNDRIDVAIAADADGVHLGRDDFPIRLARRLLGPHRIIGGSAGSIEEARDAYEEGADYLGCGPIHATATKPDAGPAAGAQLVMAIARVAPIPLIAIGGVTEAGVDLLLGAGAYGIAVVSAVCASPDPEGATRDLRRRIDAAIGDGP
jgi:thiamine-phosphate pyrophosphorylase